MRNGSGQGQIHLMDSLLVLWATILLLSCIGVFRSKGPLTAGQRSSRAPDAGGIEKDLKVDVTSRRAEIDLGVSARRVL